MQSQQYGSLQHSKPCAEVTSTKEVQMLDMSLYALLLGNLRLLELIVNKPYDFYIVSYITNMAIFREVTKADGR